MVVHFYSEVPVIVIVNVVVNNQDPKFNYSYWKLGEIYSKRVSAAYCQLVSKLHCCYSGFLAVHP